MKVGGWLSWYPDMPNNRYWFLIEEVNPDYCEYDNEGGYPAVKIMVGGIVRWHLESTLWHAIEAGNILYADNDKEKLKLVLIYG